MKTLIKRSDLQVVRKICKTCCASSYDRTHSGLIILTCNGEMVQGFWKCEGWKLCQIG